MLFILRKIRKAVIHSSSSGEPASPVSGDQNLDPPPEPALAVRGWRRAAGRYAFYAIGEILLVMIGILLALQVNTWNQEKLNRKLEKDYLNRLIIDLELDLLDLEKVIERASVNIRLTEDALLKLDADTSILFRGDAYKSAYETVRIDDDNLFYKESLLADYTFTLHSFGHQLTQISLRRAFDLNRTTFDDLMSTGKIEVIEDQKLRNHIQAYYNLMSNSLDFEENNVIPHVDYYQKIISDLGIPWWSMFSVEDAIMKNNGDPRLSAAIVNLYEANRSLLRMCFTNANSRYNRIIDIKSQIESILKTL